MNHDELNLIKFDYEKTLDFLDKADSWLFQIRNWAGVSTTGIVAYAVSSKSAITLVANVFLIIGFCFFELIYKSFHEDCVSKSYILEGLLQKSLDPDTSLPENYKFGIGHAIDVVHPKKLIRILFSRKRWHLGIVYVGLTIMTCLAAIYIKLYGTSGTI